VEKLQDQVAELEADARKREAHINDLHAKMREQAELETQDWIMMRNERDKARKRGVELERLLKASSKAFDIAIADGNDERQRVAELEADENGYRRECERMRSVWRLAVDSERKWRERYEAARGRVASIKFLYTNETHTTKHLREKCDALQKKLDAANQFIMSANDDMCEMQARINTMECPELEIVLHYQDNGNERHIPISKLKSYISYDGGALVTIQENGWAVQMTSIETVEQIDTLVENEEIGSGYE